MKLLRGVQPHAVFKQGTVATIGNFDGVHLGHQALLQALRAEALRMGLPMVVMVFEPQPSEYFHGKEAPSRLSSLREKLTVLRQCNVDYVFCLRFDARLASMTAIEFAEHFIFSMLKVRFLLIGEDFRFGRDRLGDVSLLRQLARKHHGTVQTFADFYIENMRVSSTTIRRALQQGDLEYASTRLGRPFQLCGRVVHGDGRGGQWGFPTANIGLQRKSLPLTGVYCVRVKRQNAKSWLLGVANIGCRPTVDGRKNILEIHLIDFEGCLYGDLLQIAFVHKLRDEIKFSSIDALIAQIQHDVTDAKAYFSQAGSTPMQALLQSR